jgi:hypothetical protein
MDKQKFTICACLIVILILVWHVRSQNCTMRYGGQTGNIHVIMPIDLSLEDSPSKPELEPEKDVMATHESGDKINITDNAIEDPLTMDAFINLKSMETTYDKLYRNITTADTDGPQMEGMEPPLDEFERNAMRRQLDKRQEVYGYQSFEPSDADKLSELNF